MKTKGQGAMDYMMTYGWAILVVLIVGIVLWQLGVIHMDGPRYAATQAPQLAGRTCFCLD
jgi:hypothetical protein